MRIITGKAKGMRLETIDHAALKPIDDKVKGAIFNILAPVVGGAEVCDLFAGCGAIGLEAWSRGAAEVTFVEKRREFGSIIKKNIEKLGGAEECAVWLGDVVEAVERFHKMGRKFDLVFVDPPYFDRVAIDGRGRVRQIEMPRKPKPGPDGKVPAPEGEPVPQWVLNSLDKYPILKKDGLAVLRTHKRVPLETKHLGHLRLTREEKYGEAAVSFFKAKE